MSSGEITGLGSTSPVFKPSFCEKHELVAARRKKRKSFIFCIF
jgi:hypothetical protein